MGLLGGLLSYTELYARFSNSPKTRPEPRKDLHRHSLTYHPRYMSAWF